MSLVGPRPCIDYETENFVPHHFERFLVPAGITGLWQVTARAHSTFGEALDMDVAYARGWSLGLDLRLLCKTPLQIRSAGGDGMSVNGTDARGATAAPTDTASQPVQVAVVGLGYWGPNLVRNLHELPEAEVAGVCDVRQERLEAIARRYPALRQTTDSRRCPRRPDDRGRRDRDARLDALRARFGGALEPASTCSSRSRWRHPLRRRSISSSSPTHGGSC